jgi:hypothetical protein
LWHLTSGRKLFILGALKGGWSIRPKIDFLYTDIGRGHPYYLDGVIDALIRRGGIKVMRGEANVFEIATGLSRLSWQAAEWLYKKGSSDSILGALYKLTRSNYDYNRPGRMLRLLGRDIRKKYADSPHPLIVAHPILAGILKEKKDLYYQHGEVAAPARAVVTGLGTVFVPIAETGAVFKKAGYEDRSIIITGLCVEPALVRMAGDAFETRLVRMDSGEPLTGAFFSSGAEPRAHIKKIAAAAVSVVHYGGRAVIFARHRGRLAEETEKQFRRNQIILPVLDTGTLFPSELPPALMVTYKSRREENIFTAKLFKHFDYFVAPSHERTNWALGLGLPMFIVEPAFGPFSPLNRESLLKNNVADLLADPNQALTFGLSVNRLRRQGRLAQMACAGRGKYNIDGFDRIAGYLVEKYAVRE